MSDPRFFRNYLDMLTEAPVTPPQTLDEDWQKVNKHDKTDGLSQKAVNAYRRENPGSKLKTAVTTKPSKLKKGSKAASRRKSFCARMSGMKKHRAGAKTKRDPDSPINKALRRWNCESIEEMRELIMLGESYIAEIKKGQKDSNGYTKCWPGKHAEGTKKGKNGKPVRNCVPNESLEEYGDTAKGQKMLTKVQKRAVDRVVSKKAETDPKYAKKNADTANRAWDRMTDKDLEENANAAKQAATAIAMKKAGKTPKKKFSENIDQIEQWLQQVSEEGKAKRSLCLSSKPDEELGASQLSSCKSQGLRARDGNKSHKLGKTPKSRVKVDGKKIKGNKYGGPLPDWS